MIGSAPGSGGNGILGDNFASISNIGPETYSNNSIVSFAYGINTPYSGSVTMKGNAFVNDIYAIWLHSCTGWTLSSNTINYATAGFAEAPSGFTPTASQVSFYNVGQFMATTFSCP